MSDALLKTPLEFMEDVLGRFYPKGGRQPGFPMSFGKSEIRIVPSELSVWSGINGHGKSLFLNQMILMAAAHGERTAIASFEMPAAKNLQRMVRQLLGRYPDTSADVRECLRWLEDKVIFYDHVGRGNVECMKSNFIVAAEAMGCTQFVVDSLMKCGMAEDDYNGQKAFMEDLHNFAMQYNVHVHLVAHSRKTPTEKEADMPGKMDIANGAAISNIADNVYIVWRNKDKEDKVNRHKGGQLAISEDLTSEKDAVVKCDKSREHGSEVEKKYRFWFDGPSMQYKGDPYAEPRNFLQENADCPF